MRIAHEFHHPKVTARQVTSALPYTSQAQPCRSALLKPYQAYQICRRTSRPAPYLLARAGARDFPDAPMIAVSWPQSTYKRAIGLWRGPQPDAAAHGHVAICRRPSYRSWRGEIRTRTRLWHHDQNHQARGGLVTTGTACARWGIARGCRRRAVGLAAADVGAYGPTGCSAIARAPWRVRRGAGARRGAFVCLELYIGPWCCEWGVRFETAPRASSGAVAVRPVVVFGDCAYSRDCPEANLPFTTRGLTC